MGNLGRISYDNNVNNEINLTSLFIINESIKILSHNSFTSGCKYNLTVQYTSLGLRNLPVQLQYADSGNLTWTTIATFNLRGTTMHQSSGWTYTYSVNSGQGISNFPNGFVRLLYDNGSTFAVTEQTTI